jgi:hypothetical protein
VAAVTSESNDDLVAMSSRQMMVIMMSWRYHATVLETLWGGYEVRKSEQGAHHRHDSAGRAFCVSLKESMELPLVILLPQSSSWHHKLNFSTWKIL